MSSWVSPTGYKTAAERRRENQRRIYWADPEKSRERQRAKDARRKATKKRWEMANKERRSAQKRAWAHSEKGLAYKAKWMRRRRYKRV